ncbi:transporter [Neokomagataea thailandica NBRC 106555]|uniref:AI-2E family transporter n=3 Tax=Neokomagataea TaxID=1223423 RepID=A0A4Y6V5L6_9PROT|nr:AI-2E family transporter [Neokomagataea tanensis]QDH24654.1 AI-2E family transporter [Neokomagataea tanensis]GBR53926.1 transporter [Neokomagataea thailandica NBRC 106555]
MSNELQDSAKIADSQTSNRTDKKRKKTAKRWDADDESLPHYTLPESSLRQHINVRDMCLIVLAVLAVFYSLYFTAQILLPFVFALVVNLLMLAPMRFMTQKLHLPRHLAALLLIAGMFGLVGGVATTISVPAAGWLSRVPQALPALQQKMALLRGPIDALQSDYMRLSALFNGHHVTRVVHTNSSLDGDGALSRFGTSVLAGTRDFADAFFSMLLMLFFLMTEGDTLLRRVVEIMPTFAEKRRVVQMALKIEHNVSVYLVTVTIMNVVVGVLNVLQCWLTGVPNPLLWGVLAFLLNYIPIIGPLMGMVVYFVVGLFSFPSVLHALVPPLIYLFIHILEGETITPMLLARRFTLNPVFVVGSLLFWNWLWGISGAILSVPMLAVLKIICDHIEILAPLGHILGGPPRRTLGNTLAAQLHNDA